ncbi:hypothetical protein EBT16_09890 [bacterium]|nr:hypothetical protein [bacterium]
MTYSNQSLNLPKVVDHGRAAIFDDNNPDRYAWVNTTRHPDIELAVDGNSIFLPRQQAVKFFEEAIRLIQAQDDFEVWLNERVVDEMHAHAEKQRKGNKK